MITIERATPDFVVTAAGATWWRWTVIAPNGEQIDGWHRGTRRTADAIAQRAAKRMKALHASQVTYRRRNYRRKRSI